MTQSKNKNIKILIADDDPDILLATSRVLEREGYSLLTAGDGSQALQLVTSEHPDLVLLDWEMPVMNGLEVCHQIKREEALSNTFVIIISAARQSAEDQVNGLQSGVDGYILRPIGNRELVAHIEAFVRIIRLQKELNVRNSELQNEIAEREKLMLLAQQKNQEISSIFQAAPIGIGLVKSRVMSEVNDTFCHMVGYLRNELLGKESRMVYPNDEEFERIGREKYRQIKDHGFGIVKGKLQRKDGSLIDALISSSELEPGNPDAGVTFTVTDITRHKNTEKEHDFINRTLILMNVINAALRHEQTEQALLDEICAAVARYDNYPLAWVAYVKKNKKPLLQPMSSAGVVDNAKNLDISLSVSLDDDYYAPGSPAYSLRNKKMSLRNSNDAGENCDSWCLSMRQMGYHSSIVLPVGVDDEVIGILCICTDKADAFDAMKVQVLTTLVSNLSYGIKSLRSQLDNMQKTQQLSSSENRLQAVISNVYDAILVIDKSGNLVFSNPAAQQLFDRTEEQLMGMPFGFPISTSDTSTIELVRHDGTLIEVEMRVSNISWNNQPAYVSSMHDITQRVQAVDQAKQYAETLHTTLVETIQMIAMALEKRDPYTSGHQKRVAELAVAIAIEMGLDEDRVEGIHLGGLIHDIGKIYIPAEILSRPGKLEFYEFAIIKTHSQVGYDIVKDVNFPWPVADIVLQHHERLDGSGYPAGLTGDEISLEARILTVADVVEAISANRPYRPALDIQVGLDEILDKRGIWYEPAAVDACLRLFQQNKFEWST